jgi:putative transcriptional regulator
MRSKEFVPHTGADMSTNKTHPLSDEELAAFEATRDIKEELKQALQDLQEGRGRVVYSPLIAVRKSAGVTQQQFAEFLGISVDTLEDWEQQRQHPSKTALMMIAIALSKPEVLRIGFANLDKQSIHSTVKLWGSSRIYRYSRPVILSFRLSGIRGICRNIPGSISASPEIVSSVCNKNGRANSLRLCTNHFMSK